MKQLLFITCLFSPLIGWSQSGNYTVTGKLPGTKAPAKAYLVQMTVGKPTVDSVQIQDGAFSFKGTVSEPIQARLVVEKGETGLNRTRPREFTIFYLEPGTITISSPDSLANALISGTPSNNVNQKLSTVLKPTTEKMNQLMSEYRSATAEQKQSKEFMANLDKQEEAISGEQKKLKAQFIKENPNSVVSMYTLQRYDYAPDYAEVSPLFNGLTDAVRNTKPGKEYATLLNTLKATSIGAMAPEFSLADTLGKAVSLSSFREKYVLVDFWASWCGPCRQENPNVVKNFHQYKDKNFTVLGVSLDRPNAKEAWIKAIHKDGLDWTQVSDLKFWDNEVAKQYGIRSIPQNFLIGPDGKIMAKNIRGDELGKKLGEVLNAKP